VPGLEHAGRLQLGPLLRRDQLVDEHRQRGGGQGGHGQRRARPGDQDGGDLVLDQHQPVGVLELQDPQQ
jgi:hypothetical protein